MTLSQTLTAIGVLGTASFLASGGTAPYIYSVRNLPTKAGGTVNANTGVYTAPAVVNAGSYGPPTNIYDTIVVTDADGNTASSQILVGDALLLFCDIIQNQLGLAKGRVYLWDQKINQPNDASLYVAVKMLSCKPFGNVNKFDGAGSDSNSIQYVRNYALMEIDAISRDTSARDRKEEIIMAVQSNYSQSQQTANGFYIGKLPPGSQFLNLSEPDGAAIPYRFNICMAMQFTVTKVQAVASYDEFPTPQVVSNQ